MAFRLVIIVKQRVCFSFHTLQLHFLSWVKPPTTFLVLGTLNDLLRGKSALLAGYALLRQQCSILYRQIKRPVYKKTDRLPLVLLTSMVRTRKQALSLVQEDDTATASIGSFSRYSANRKSSESLMRPLVRFVLPVSVTTCLLAIGVYLAVLIPASRTLPVPLNPYREGALPLAQTTMTVFVVLCGLLLVLFVEPPIDWRCHTALSYPDVGDLAFSSLRALFPTGR